MARQFSSHGGAEARSEFLDAFEVDEGASMSRVGTSSAVADMYDNCGLSPATSKSSGSGLRAGYLLGTTRTFQLGVGMVLTVLRLPRPDFLSVASQLRSRRVASEFDVRLGSSVGSINTGTGVSDSLPVQKGQSDPGKRDSDWSANSSGR